MKNTINYFVAIIMMSSCSINNKENNNNFVLKKTDSSIFKHYAYFYDEFDSNIQDEEIKYDIRYDSFLSSDFIRVFRIKFKYLKYYNMYSVFLLDSLKKESVYNTIIEINPYRDININTAIQNRKIDKINYFLFDKKYISNESKFSLTNNLYILVNIYYRFPKARCTFCSDISFENFMSENIHYITEKNIQKYNQELKSELYPISCFISSTKEEKTVKNEIKRARGLNNLYINEIKNNMMNKNVFFFYSTPNCHLYKIDYRENEKRFLKMTDLKDWVCDTICNEIPLHFN